MASFNDFLRARELYQGEVVEWTPSLRSDDPVVEARFTVTLPHPAQPEMAFAMTFSEHGRGGTVATDVTISPEWRRAAGLNKAKDVDLLLKARLENYRDVNRMNWGVHVNKPLLDHCLLALASYADERKPGAIRLLSEGRVDGSLFRVLRARYSQSCQDYGVRGGLLVRRSESDNNQLCESSHNKPWADAEKARLRDLTFLEHDRVTYF
jgi:hypothetical protein